MNVVDIQTEKPEGRGPRLIAIHKMIPNLITLTAMAAGLASIQHALAMQWDKAVMALLLALILDGIDGSTARLLKVTSEFGAMMDSLSDFLAFGIAPAIILYTWVLEESGRVGWIAMIFYTSATALRLARFNVEQKKLPYWHKSFFSGIPSPAGAGLALLPLILWFQYPEFFQQFNFASPLVGLWTIIVAGLMVSRIPTFSIKAVKIPARMGMPLLAGTALLLAAFANIPWATLTTVAIAYLASIPVSFFYFKSVEKSHEDEDEEADMLDV